MADITLLRKICMTILAFAGVVMLHSCESIFEYEGDCSVNYLVDFSYDMNMKYADAFAKESGKVMLYAFDQDGYLVWQKTEEGECLAEEDYAMSLELQPGLYDLIAWSFCDIADDCFSLPFTKSPLTKEDLVCELNRKTYASGKAYSDRHLGTLLHGCIEDLEIGDTEGTYVSKMQMTKNTNQIRVVLQNLSGAALDKDDFHFYITESNGLMAHDNSLLPCEDIEYRQWRKESAVAGSQHEQGDVVSSASAVIAELTVGRLMSDSDAHLVVCNGSGKEIVSIPLVDYALLVKGYYDHMTDQEYLDRQDVYEMVFFLNDGASWVSSHIYINSWKVVLSDTDLN